MPRVTDRRTVPAMPTDPTPKQRDERVALPLDAETALRALLKVDPDALPVESAQRDKDRSDDVSDSDRPEQ